MATIKKRVLLLSDKRQIRLSGHTLCISAAMEVGEGFTKNLFCAAEGVKPGSGAAAVLNPHGLTKDDWFEIADYEISKWMFFKDRMRQFGIDSPQIFKTGQ